MDSHDATIRVLVCEVGQEPQERDIPPTLEAFQAIVGGDIETVSLGEGRDRSPALAIYCNENGFYANLPQNACGIMGTFFYTKIADFGEISPTPGDLADCRDHYDAHRTLRHDRAL